MKRISIAISTLLLVFSALSAQTMSDALTLGQTNYYGTARTLGMGNAVTAVGGDMGSISINPAGGAVSAFSQVTFSTGWNTASSSSSAVLPTFYSGRSASKRAFSDYRVFPYVIFAH